MPTTTKERRRVLVKREVVRRERGWREGWGDISSFLVRRGFMSGTWFGWFVGWVADGWRDWMDERLLRGGFFLGVRKGGWMVGC